MRLIDADDLKEYLEECRYHSFNLDDAIHAVDDAPTVDKGYQEGHIDGVLQGEKLCARPLGEWINHSCYKDVIICSNCNIGGNRYYKDFKFCPNCGADMRGDNNDVS